VDEFKHIVGVLTLQTEAQIIWKSLLWKKEKKWEDKMKCSADRQRNRGVYNISG
jgi:hypothetical protein